jgi:drug/metabolite transporter (DMT)-like permease
MGPVEFVALIVLGALWGASFLLIRIGVADFGPVALVGVRLAIASAIVLAFTRGAGQTLPRVQDWRRWLVVGTINTALPFVLFSVAEMRITASLGSILNATTPFFAAVLGAVWLGQRLARGRLVGLVVGLVGVVLVVGWDVGLQTPDDYFAAGIGTVGAASYALGTLLVRRLFPHAGSTTLAAGQQTAAACLMVPLSAVAWPNVLPGADAWFAVVGLGVATTAIAYLIFFWLLARAGALAALSVTFIIPVFGVAWGATFLGEAFGLMQAVGLLIILVGVALVNEVRLPGLSRA